jgi:galactoside 2-L-fucosyltransferase 1/2
MFIFASAYGLARIHGCRLYASEQIVHELKGIFKMSVKENLWLSANQANGLHGVIAKDTVCSFLPEMLRPNAFKNIELRGYWQSYLYFDAYRDEIREIFSGRSEVLKRLAHYFSDITKIDCPTCSIPSSISHQELRQIIRTNYNMTWIGIHIRRSDFTRLGFASSDQYIRRAMAYYKRRFYKQKLRFLVASDDKPYCYKLFATELNIRQVFILPIYFQRGDDLIALSFCHHSIVTGGTYGFWAAYLTGGEVIHDIVYPAGCARSDYYPPWFKLTGEPKQKLG